MFTEEEFCYIKNPNTHVDFLVYNDLQKTPVLAIEVDGFTYHMEGSVQYVRDRRKDWILERSGIPLIRVSTNGSQEIETIRERLLLLTTREDGQTM